MSPVPVGATSSYIVNTVPAVQTERMSRHVTMMVALPEVTPVYSTSDMVYTSQPYQISYFAKSNWIETPAHMLQPLIVQTLQNTRAFHAVGSSAAMGHVNFIVNTQLLRFEQDFTKPQSVFRLALRVQLLDATQNQIIATRDIAVVEPAPQNTPYGGVVAANRATAKALHAIAQFCLRYR
jgi:cholesterol transport system auxiliary component